MTVTNETPKLERRVRITIEGRVGSETGTAIWVDHGDDRDTWTRVHKVDGVTIEELTTSYSWRDGDVVQAESRHSETYTLTRHDRGELAVTWFCSPSATRWSDDDVSRLVDGKMSDSYPTVRILRYQAGGIGS